MTNLIPKVLFLSQNRTVWNATTLKELWLASSIQMLIWILALTPRPHLLSFAFDRCSYWVTVLPQNCCWPFKLNSNEFIGKRLKNNPKLMIFFDIGICCFCNGLNKNLMNFCYWKQKRKNLNVKQLFLMHRLFIKRGKRVFVDYWLVEMFVPQGLWMVLYWEISQWRNHKKFPIVDKNRVGYLPIFVFWLDLKICIDVWLVGKRVWHLLAKN